MNYHNLATVAFGIFALLFALGVAFLAFDSLHTALYQPEDIKSIDRRTTGSYWFQFSMFSIASFGMFGIGLCVLNAQVLYS